MKMLNTIRAATLATLAGAAFSTTTLAQADDYYGYNDPNQKCRNKESDAQVVGGLLGAVVGGVIGSQVAGDGQRTEGSAVGAVLGGLAGVALGDESVDCDKRRQERYRSGYYENGYRTRRTYYPSTYPSGRGYGYNTGYRTAGYRTGGYGYDTYGYSDHERHERYEHRERYRQTRRALNDVRYRLADLRRENRQLEEELRWGYDPRAQRRREWVCDEIGRLEKKERRLRRRLARL